MAEIIQKGIESKQFVHSDAMQLAYDIHQATLRYNHPVALKNNALDVLGEDLNRLVDLLYSGLRSSS